MTLHCYHNTYFKIDVLLLTDVFEIFWIKFLKPGKLDLVQLLHSTWISTVGLIKDRFWTLRLSVSYV